MSALDGIFHIAGSVNNLKPFLTSTTNGAFPPLILRRRDDRRVVERLRWRLGAIACPQRPHIFGTVDKRPLFLYLFSVYADLAPRPRARPRPRPRPRRGGRGGRGPDVRVDVWRTEGRPPSS